MALWGNAKLFLSILAINFCCTVILAEIPRDCCLEVTGKPISKTIVADYYKQLQGCNISATVFISRRGRTMCAPVNEPWVNQLMHHVDSLKKKCKEQNYKPSRCFGVKKV